MYQFSCHTVLWFASFPVIVSLLVGGTVGAINGDEPKHNSKFEQLQQSLEGMTNEELRSLARDGAIPAKISDLHVSPDQLNSSLVKVLARRLETPKMRTADPTVVKGIATDAPKAEADDEVNGSVSGEDMLVGQAEIKLEKVAVETFLGEPFSTGTVELKFEPGHGPIIYPDQQLFLDATDKRAHYITFELFYQDQNSELTMMVDRIRVSFLLRGVGPCQVSLSSVDGLLLDKQDIEPIRDDTRHGELLRQWWKQFSVIPTGYGREQIELKESLLDVLARRVQLPGPWPNIAEFNDGVNETSLEHQFERGIGMLFGIESVKLAMRADTTLSQSGRIEKADQSIPVHPVLQSVMIPNAPQDTWIEPIAMHVPAECFYLRTGSIANYREFRRFLVGWGGNLNDIVSSGAVDHQSRERIEGQLGISPDQLTTEASEKLISDVALIGCDPMFDDGASIGILFQARDSKGLASILKGQRNQARARVPESAERRITLDGHNVSFLASDDHRIRSYYAIDGDFHLVTNSFHLLTRFFQAGDGTQSLGKLNEFRYARDQINQIAKKNRQQPLAMLYLSDPFFQNLISPQYRIELTRRRQAAQELKQYQLALLVAKAEHVNAATTNQLIKSELLPAGFGTRPDGSYPILEKGKFRDSMRGTLGYFLPIPDVQLQRATQTEIHSYHQFVAQYREEWRRIDPVTVVFSRDHSGKDGLQQVALDIVITPYARQHYALLYQHLAPASAQRVAPMGDDLISLDTSIRAGLGSPSSHLLYLGLRDDDVPYVFQNGQIILVDRAKGSTYAKRNSYAAISPPSTGILQLLASTFSRVQRQQDDQAVPAERPLRAPLRAVSTPNSILFSFLASYAISKSSDAIKYVRSVSSNGFWMVASDNRALRQSVPDEIGLERIPASSQVRLRVKSLTNSKVEPYIQAYTYLASRKASCDNARFLNDVTSWLQLPIEESRDSVEAVMGAQLRCPLGGDFRLSEADSHSYWAGTQWAGTSYFAETKAPTSWKFAFLEWLRGLDLRFDIDQTTLRAHIDMALWQPEDHDGDNPWTPLKLQLIGNPTNAAVFDVSPLIGQAGFPSMPTWVLGIRVQSEKQSFRVISVHPNSPASRAGILVGDQIIAVDRVRPESSERLAALIESARDGKGTLFVQLMRNGTLNEFVVPLRNR